MIIWRVLFALAIVPNGLAWGPFIFLQMIIAGMAWLVLGPDQDRTDWLMLRGPASWVIAPTDWLARKAGL